MDRRRDGSTPPDGRGVRFVHEGDTEGAWRANEADVVEVVNAMADADALDEDAVPEWLFQAHGGAATAEQIESSLLRLAEQPPARERRSGHALARQGVTTTVLSAHARGQHSAGYRYVSRNSCATAESSRYSRFGPEHR